MKTKIIIPLTVFGLVSILSTQPVFSHSGGTDSNGCHTNRKTGDYHCHNKKLKVKTQKQQEKILSQTKSKNMQSKNDIYRDGPYKWEDANGLNIAFDINKVPEPIRERFLIK
jgi:hypothetical protein